MGWSCGKWEVVFEINILGVWIGLVKGENYGFGVGYRLVEDGERVGGL